MYLMKLIYFDKNGLPMGSDSSKTVPGFTPGAVQEFVRKLPIPAFLGQKPSMVFVDVEGKTNVLVRLPDED